jgi:hypothetical protein
LQTKFCAGLKKKGEHRLGHLGCARRDNRFTNTHTEDVLGVCTGAGGALFSGLRGVPDRSRLRVAHRDLCQRGLQKLHDAGSNKRLSAY